MSETARRPKATIRKRFVRTGLVCLGLYVLVCIGCASCQRRLLYFPRVLTSDQVAEVAKSEGMELWRGRDGTTIGCKRLIAGQTSQGQVLILHGNAALAFQDSHYADVIQQAAPLDTFVVEYPGYADRPGTPTERSLYESAEDALQSLPTNRPTYLLGESLGTGVAAYLAGHYPERISGVVLLAPYNALTEVAQAHMPLLPVHLLLIDRFPAEKYLRKYHGPVAVLVGGQDPVVPERFGRRLYDRYSGPKRLWEFPKADHGTVMFQPKELWSEIFDFLQRPARRKSTLTFEPDLPKISYDSRTAPAAADFTNTASTNHSR